MSEHAFDPMPDEEQETATVIAGDEIVVPTVALDTDTLTTPTATITTAQLRAAIKDGRWHHTTPGTELWLNTSFPPMGRDLDAFVQELQAYGIEVN